MADARRSRGATPVPEVERERARLTATPTRQDDTVVIAGGRRATREELLEYVASDLERRAAARGARPAVG